MELIREKLNIHKQKKKQLQIGINSIKENNLSEVTYEK